MKRRDRKQKERRERFSNLHIPPLTRGQSFHCKRCGRAFKPVWLTTLRKRSEVCGTCAMIAINKFINGDDE